MPETSERFVLIHEEPIALERWVWVAVYSDGTSLRQFDPDTGRFHRFSEIDLERLAAFALQDVTDPERLLEVRISPGRRPIHFYRNLRLNVGTPEEARVRVYCFGYQETLHGRNHKVILQVHPNGTVIVGEA